MYETETRHHGGAALRRAMAFVAACRSAEPLGEYPHVGDLQWWCRTGALDDLALWRFVYERAGFRPLRRVYLYTWEGRSR